MPLPYYEDVALGSLGRLSDGTAVMRVVGDELIALRMLPRFAAWLYEDTDAAKPVWRNDCARILLQGAIGALEGDLPVRRTASRVQNEIVEQHDLIFLPLQTRWGYKAVLVYVDDAAARASLVERIYRSMRDGVVALVPVEDRSGQLIDFQVVAMNDGAASLLQTSRDDAIWKHFLPMHPGLRQSAIGALLSRVMLDGGTAAFDLDETAVANGKYLKCTACRIDDILLVTIVDLTESKLREDSFRLMFEANPVPMCVTEARTLRIIDVNQAAVEHYGYNREQFLGMSGVDICSPAQHDILRRLHATPSDATQHTWRHLKADGTEIQVLTYSRPLYLQAGAAHLVAVIDVTARNAAEEELRRTQSFLDTVVENIPAMLFVKDAVDDRILLLNRAGESLTGISKADLIKGTAPNASATPNPAANSLLFGNSNVAFEEVDLPAPAQGRRYIQMQRLSIADERGAPRYLLGIGSDVTEQRLNEAKIAHLAHHDVLTDLANRTLFQKRLHTSLAQIQEFQETISILYVDLDRFKQINDTFGHPVGDALLCKVAKILLDCAGERNVVSRFGGDEFLILQTAMDATDDPSALAERIIERLSSPITIQGHELRISASIGVVVAPRDGDDPDELLRNADLALYRAKSAGKSTFRMFEPEMKAWLTARREMETDVRKALAENALTLHYQPLVDLADDRICGCEALLRWDHPERGAIAPADFIPLAEEVGLIDQIGEWVLRQACAEAMMWPDAMKVAVNLSPVQFRDKGLISSVTSALASTGLSPQRLELEITESVLLADSEANLSILHRLRNLGVRIAMDDFGTGYSSLGYLRDFPFDKIKIDRSFIRDLNSSPHCMAIVRAVVGLGSSLGIRTNAEGVETAQQLDVLRALGCMEAQGFHFSRPLPVEDLRRFLGTATATSQAA